jgi:hypothetical protein
VNRLEKWRLRVNDAVRAQDTVDFVHDHSRIDDMLEHGLHDDRVDAFRAQGYPVRVGDHLHQRRRAKVERQDAMRPVAVDRLDAVPHPAAAHDQHCCGRPW